MPRAKSRGEEAEALPPTTPEGVKESDKGTGEVGLRQMRGDNVDDYPERPLSEALDPNHDDLEAQFEAQGYRSQTTDVEVPEGYTDVFALQGE